MKFFKDNTEINVSVGDMWCWWNTDIYLVIRDSEEYVDLLLVFNPSGTNFILECDYSKRRFKFSLENGLVSKLH